MISECIKKVVHYEDLDEKEAYECMMQIVSGNASQIQIASFLTALSMKGENVNEITGFVKAMREVAVSVSPNIDTPLVDTCGTGGDRLKTFNVSTVSSIIAASCGVVVAKHGNRSITSKCGGADLLESLGINIDGDAENVEKCMEEAGIGFMFAPNFHPAMKYVMPVRRELGIRTVFNILGPLTSPANADIQLLGVFDPEYVETMARVLKNLGVKRAMVVHGFDEDGNPAMDEISSIGKTKVAFLENGKIEIKNIYPEDFGIERGNKELLKASSDLDENKKIALSLLRYEDKDKIESAKMDLCLINAAAILFLSKKVSNFKEGVKMALMSIESNRTSRTLEQFAKSSKGPEIVGINAK